MRDDISAGKKAEGAVSQAKGEKTDISSTSDGSKKVGRVEEEKLADRSKFKKVKMSVFNGTDPDSWFF